MLTGQITTAEAAAEAGVDRSTVMAQRQAAGRLDDATPGGRPIHGLLAWEEAEILALFEEWGPIDLSHRKLAHRGSYTERVWVSPSTVDRVLARNGLALQGLPRPSRS